MQNIGLCIDKLIESHNMFKDFTPDTPDYAMAYAILIRMEVERLLEAMRNVNN